jgi:hypothetical protein
LKRLLDIPEKLKIYDMMAVGFPAYQLGPRSPRNAEEMTHFEHYDRAKYRTDAEIKKYIIGLRRNERKEMEGLTRGPRAGSSEV